MPKARPGKGGYRKPASPAPSSGPGALSQRTDGRAGDAAARLVRQAPSTGYGDKAALQQAQSRMPEGGGGGSPQGGSGGGGGGGVPRPQLFSPTQRPGEPLTEGANAGPGSGPANMLAPDPLQVLRAMAAAYPHPDVLSLLDFYEGGY